MIEEPSTAAAATESLSLPGREHREHGEHLAKVSPNLMHTQKTHLQTSPSAAPFITAEEEGASNRVLTPVGRQGRGQQGQEWTWKFLVPGAEQGLSIFSCLPLSLPLSLFFVISLQLSPKQCLRRGEQRTQICSKWSLAHCFLRCSCFTMREQVQGPAGCSWVHPKASLLLLKALVAHWSLAPCGIREETQCITPPPKKQLALLETAPHLSHLGGLSHHSQPPSHFGEV